MVDALPIARQIAEALEAAHEAGIIHRDLKPADTKVRDDGTVTVLDFGKAKAAMTRDDVFGPRLFDFRVSSSELCMARRAIIRRGPQLGRRHRDVDMHDELSVLKLVTARLEAAGIAYMVTGSVAVSLYAEPRMTRDVDLVVELGPADSTRVVDMFSEEFLCDADRIMEAIASRSMFNLIHTTAVVKIDIIVRKDSAYREEEFRRRRLSTIDDVKMWVVSAEDLVLSKLDWARESRSEVQLRDVRNVIAAQASLDWSYLEAWAARIGVVSLLAEVRR